ncbi:MAG: hypothetical protein GX346_07560 [Clostridiales bacterium]|nr:hypothetical protein [Clostridiales bacterium]
MKRLFVIIIFVIVVLVVYFNSLKASDSEDNSKIAFETGSFKYYNNINENKMYKGSVIDNEETALSLAIIILDAIDFSKGGGVPQKVFYDKENEVWIVSFWSEIDKDSSKTIKTYISLKKENGAVDKIWYDSG